MPAGARRPRQLLHSGVVVGPASPPGGGRHQGGETPPAVAYLYTEDRRSEHLAALPAGFPGMLQVDGYCGFKSLLKDRPPSTIRLAF